MKNVGKSDSENMRKSPSCIIYVGLVWCRFINMFSFIRSAGADERMNSNLIAWTAKLIELSFLLTGRIICAPQHVPRSAPAHKGEPAARRTS